MENTIIERELFDLEDRRKAIIRLHGSKAIVRSF